MHKLSPLALAGDCVPYVPIHRHELIRLDGSPKYAMFCNVIPGIVNVVLDWIFIFPLGLGVKGAAMATSISCILGGTMALFYFVRLSEMLNFVRLKLSIADICDAARHAWAIIKIGFATLLTELAMSVISSPLTLLLSVIIRQ